MEHQNFRRKGDPDTVKVLPASTVAPRYLHLSTVVKFFPYIINGAYVRELPKTIVLDLDGL